MAIPEGSGASAEIAASTRTCNCSNDYQAIFNGVNVAIMIHEVEDGHILDANQTACELFGQSRDELSNVPLSHIWPAAADPHSLAPIRESFLESVDKRVTLACCCRRKDGTEFWADVQLQVWEIGGSPCILNVMRDITERRERELRLRESEHRLHDIVESSRDIIYRLNIATGRVEYMSGAVIEILGYSPEEMIAMSREEHLVLVHEDNRAVLAGHKDLVISGKASGFELSCVRFRMCHKSGEWRWLEGNFGYPRDASGKFKYVVGVMRDASRQVAAEDALRVSEELYRRLVENASVGIVVAQDGCLRYANPKISEYTGFTSEELLSRPWPELLHPEDRATVYEKHRARHKSDFGSETYRVRVIRKDGSFGWIEIGGVLVQWEGRPATINFLTDVDRQVEAEQSLRSERDLISRLMETTPVGVFKISKKLEVVFANERAQQILGITRDEICGRPHFQDWTVFDTNGSPLTPEQMPFGTVMQTLQPVYGFRHSLNRPDGRMVYLSANITPIVDAHGHFDGMVVTTEDITERWRNEEQVRMFKTIADHSPYGVVLWSLDDRVVYANEAAAEMHGYTVGAMMGQPVTKFVNNDQLVEIRASKRVLLASGTLGKNDLFHVHSDGHLIPTMTAVTPVHDNAGNPKFMATTIVDMTETRRLQEYAARAERLEAVGQIAGQVAHDFNNLLGPLVAYPELLRDEIGPLHKAAPYIDAMESAACQMAEINQQLLTLGRRGHYSVEPINLNGIVRQVLEQMRPHTARVAVALDLQSDLMNTKAGAAQISRAIFNLVNNALDAMDEIGQLTVRTENWYADQMSGNYSHIPKGEYVKLTVADTGCGIDPAHLSRVFEPFFTTKAADANRGSGLGLSVVHAVVNDHHGFIDIDSRVGEGTSIYVYLPVTRETNDQEVVKIPEGGSESILVIDDDPLQREVSFRLLTRLGYNVHTADSGERALARLKLESFDLIILDMIMPGGMDGAETLEQILTVKPSQRAIIASGYVENESVDRVRLLGATVFLRKPLTMTSLALAIREELDRATVLLTS